MQAHAVTNGMSGLYSCPMQTPFRVGLIRSGYFFMILSRTLPGFAPINPRPGSSKAEKAEQHIDPEYRTREAGQVVF